MSGGTDRGAITQADADQIAARVALMVIQSTCLGPYVRAQDIPAVTAALKPIEQWLRRRALGGDKIAIRQAEKELGRQVRMRGKAR